ncbi:HAMP domain-containing sensor histidine kinase [Nocardiopsis rhodophaea]|uniref:sensor histidine kinase n=1 Tax=Nocardiopsis rhodophaea TaxID=280238 RepID=UPI0031DDC429
MAERPDRDGQRRGRDQPSPADAAASGGAPGRGGATSWPKPAVWTRWPLRVRLAVLTAVVVAGAVLAGAGVAFVVVRHTLYGELDGSLRREATRVERQIDRTTWLGSAECGYATAPACVQIIDARGRVEPEPGGGSPEVPGTAVGVARGERGALFVDTRIGEIPLRGYIAPIGGDRAVQVSIRSDRVEATVVDVGARLALAGAVGVVLAGGLGYLVARTGLRPVARLTRTAETIAATRDPGHRIDVYGSDELARLADSFNTMLDELERSVTAQRRLVADASHELRTPLTGLRTNIDLLARDLPPERRTRIHRTLRTQITEMTGLVNDLIELARDEAPEGRTEDVRLDEAVRHCVDSERRNRPGIRCDVRVEPTVVVGVPERLARAVTNLLDNAAKFSPRNGRVEVGLVGGELTVRDHGPGIDPVDLPHVFDRFYRARDARGLPGSGLGLAIVRQVAEGHGAELRAEPAPGGGTVFRMSFPAEER